MINIFSVYLILLTCFNIYNLIQIISVMMSYYRRFKKLPPFLQKIAVSVSKDIFRDFTARQLSHFSRDIMIIGVLLIIVLALNGFLWYIRLTPSILTV